MKVDVYTKNGSKAGKQVDLPDAVFGAEPNEHVIYLSVKQHLANARSGTHKAKEKGEITASTRKIKKQKGTGTARAGSMKSPLFRGGGRVFGPKPRDYSFKLNKKVKDLAGRSALSAKVTDGELKVIENFSMDEPKTKEFVSVINSFEGQGKKTLMIVPKLEGNVYLSSRNIDTTLVSEAQNVSVYDILNANVVLLNEAAVDILAERFANLRLNNILRRWKY